MLTAMDPSSTATDTAPAGSGSPRTIRRSRTAQTPGTVPGGLRRILLATDLSPASEPAADEAIRLALGSGARLVILCVIDPGRLRLPGGTFLRRIDQERGRMEVGVQGLVRESAAAGVAATFLVWEGDPAETILAAAEAEDVDAILIGSHRRGRLGRLVLGSVSARVVADSDRPVHVVTRRGGGQP